jgi:hypothetical protein
MADVRDEEEHHRPHHGSGATDLPSSIRDHQQNRLALLFLHPQGIGLGLCKSTVKSPIPPPTPASNSSIPAALVLLRPNRAHLRLPHVQAHPRRSRSRPLSLAAVKSFSNQGRPPWPSCSSSASICFFLSDDPEPSPSEPAAQW